MKKKDEFKEEKRNNLIRLFSGMSFMVFGILSILNYFYFVLPLLDGTNENSGINSIIPIASEYLLVTVTVLSLISIFTKLKIFGWYDEYANLVYRGFMSQKGFLRSLVTGLLITLVLGVISFFFFKQNIIAFANVFCLLESFVFFVCFIWGMLEEFDTIPYE